MPAAMSIWLSTQPPKMWPLALMSVGPGITRRIGTRSSPFSSSPCCDVAAASSWPLIAEEHQGHQRGPEQHREADAERGRDEQVA